ncbi:lactate utilization protein B/C [Flavobacterium hiemivividum]|uniref:Lactate utilization protein B/C n=1 Tax=Flavobacterium hiemivividum TaxID=2541734 RepID=A0A4R5CRL4_9FLAO|nr:lactate utilization protein B/C [Flavobacterium hiemivividum]TDE02157.1 lactate utilization protein B/C [Flavobacterium hiemivividum]
MSLFRKIFGSSISASDEEKEKEKNSSTPDMTTMSIDEQFIYNFKKNGGKFLYCENFDEVKEQFENILQENDWYESNVLCYEPKLFNLLDENKLTYVKGAEPKFLFSNCENLIAEEGSILFCSKQIKQHKPNELPINIVVIATTSQIVAIKSDGLTTIKKKYESDIPTNITAIKYFEKAKEEDFTQYGSVAKNLYLLLLEDL